MMGLFEQWPYVNFHDLNLDWIIKEIPKVFASRDEAQASAEASAQSAAASQLSADAALASQEAAHQSELNAAQSEENAADSEASAKNYADHIADPVAGLVTDWLDDHVTPTTPIVDDTLTISGAAADAKVTGFIRSDADNIISDNYDVTDNLVDFEFDFNDWLQGSPRELTANYMVHNKNIVELTPGEILYTVFKNVNYAPGTIYAALWLYDSSDQYISTVDLLYKNMAASSYTIPEGVAYGYVGFNTKSTSRAITPTIIKDLNADIYIGKTNVDNSNWYKKYIPYVNINADNLNELVLNVDQNSIYRLTWENKIYYPNTGWTSSNTRIASNVLKTKFRTAIKVASGYKYGVNVWTDETLTTRISDTGWLTQGSIIPENTILTLSLAKSDDAAINSSDGENIYLASVPVSETEKEYTYAGIEFPYKKNGYNIKKIFDKVTPSSDPTAIMNGGAIFDGKLFQAYNPDLLQIYDITTGTLLNEFSCKCDHGDCVSFSNEYYDSSDDYPLLYCTADTTPAKVYVNRVTDTESSLIRTLVFPLSAGYYGGHVLDADNNVIYIIAYKNQNYHTDADNNKIKITAWNLEELTNNGDNTFTPEFISEKEIPFIYCCQDQSFVNGRIIVISSQVYSVQPTRIYVLDSADYDVTNIFKDLPQNLLTTEAEMISHGEENGNYYMIIGANNGYYKVTFE